MLSRALGLWRPAEPIPVHQVHNATCRGRNKAFMIDAKAHLGGPVESILSFGCSTGEECADLAEVFPEAHILGLDVNPDVLSKARRFESAQIEFQNSTSAAIASGAPYDIIFAMNVLCLFPQTAGLDNIAHLYPFERFNDTVAMLDLHLKPGGILGAYNAQYFIEDTQCGHDYTSVLQPTYPAAGWIEKCEPNGDRACRTMFHRAGLDYSWLEWKMLIADLPKAEHREAGKYRQLWLDPAASRGRRPDIALWQKRG